jgi:hypothetical protein
VNFKAIEIFQAPKPVRRISQCAGFALSMGWLGYAGYISITENLGWPPNDERYQIAAVAILIFAAGWLIVRLPFWLVRRLHGRFCRVDKGSGRELIGFHPKD